MLSNAGVVVMFHHNLWPGMNLLMYLLAVMTCIIAFPLDEILETVIPHVTIEDLLYLIFVLTIYNSWGWRRVMSMTWNGVGEG
jgi:hypothetical protein